MAYQGKYAEVPVVWRDKKGSQLNIPKAIVTVSAELFMLFIKKIAHQTTNKQIDSVYLGDAKA
jgi:hypothetical protein